MTKQTLNRTAWNSTLRPVSKKKLATGDFGLKRTTLKRVGKQGKQDRKNLAAAKKKYDGKCVVCGATGTQHHHLLKRSLYPGYVNEPANHVLLCDYCHRIAHKQPIPAYVLPPVVYQARQRILERMTDRAKKLLCEMKQQ